MLDNMPDKCWQTVNNNQPQKNDDKLINSIYGGNFIRAPPLRENNLLEHLTTDLCG